MQIRKSRWSQVYESAEEEQQVLFAGKHITAVHWQGKDGQELERHYNVDTQLWCAEGQLRCTVAGTTYSLQPGDVLDIPAGSDVFITVGFGGCATYQSEPKRF